MASSRNLVSTIGALASPRMGDGTRCPETRTTLELELYYVMINSYTKFQVNISKDGREKSGKLNFSKGQ